MSFYKANILLVNPWIVDFAAYDFWIKPLGFLIIANILRENNYQITLLDCLDRNSNLLSNHNRNKRLKRNGTGHFLKTNIEKPTSLKWVPRHYSRYGLPYTLVCNQLKNLNSPDVILVSSSMTYWYPGVIQIIKLLKSIFPKIPVVLGGIYATLCYEHAQKVSGADYIISGEGEVESLKIVDKLTGNSSAWEKYKGLDDYPIPAYDLYTSLESVALLSSRGCPFNCPVCASNILSGRYRRKSINKIIQEIIYLNCKLKVVEFAFYDDALLYKKEEHIIPLLEKIIDRNLNIHFHIPNGIQTREVDRSVANLMKTAGFKKINLSYESVNIKRQRELCSKVTNDDLCIAVDNLIKAGFKNKDISAYVLMGLPHQDFQEIIDSILFVYEQDIKVSLASFSPIPGTKYWYESIKIGLLSETTDPILTNNSIFPLYKNKYNKFIALRTLTGTGNKLVAEGKSPLNDPTFLNQIKNVSP